MGILEYIVIATIIIAAVYVGMTAYEKAQNETGEVHQVSTVPIIFEEIGQNFDQNIMVQNQRMFDENLH